MPRTRSLAWSLVRQRYTFFQVIRRDRAFLIFLTTCFFITGFAFPYPDIARWVGFALAGYTAIANDSIQTVGTEKTEVTDIRSATLIDFIYALLLYGFVTVSVIPMSTTWVFIGLLGGREIAMSLAARDPSNRSLRKSWQLMRKNLAYAGIGLGVSIILAIAAQPDLRRAMWATLF